MTSLISSSGSGDGGCREAARLEEIIARLEAAVGPDRVLADEVLLACGWVLKDSVWYISDAHAEHEAEPCWSECDNPPDPTASIDAALTLVPEGWTRAVDATVPEAGITVWLHKRLPSTEAVLSDHVNEAIATCIAALKARKSRPTTPPQSSQEQGEE